MSAPSNGAHPSLSNPGPGLSAQPAADVGPVVPPTAVAPSRGAARAVSLLLRGASVAAPWVTILRGDTSARALSWLGLVRRPSPLRGVLTFGTGALVGASVALLVAPTSGADLRANLLSFIGGPRQRRTPLQDVAPVDAAPDAAAGDRGVS
jgi:hypothetical protein